MSYPVVEQLRSLRSVANRIGYGEKPNVTVCKSMPPKFCAGLFLITAIVVLIACLAFGMDFSNAFGYAISYGVLAVSAYLLFPLLSFLFRLIRHREIPDEKFLEHFSASQKWFSCGFISFLLTAIVDTLIPLLLGWGKVSTKHPHASFVSKKIAGLFGASQFLLAWLIIFIAVGFALIFLFYRWSVPRKAKEQPLTVVENPPFGLWLGKSTGWLAHLYHSVGIAPDQQVILSVEDAAQNILVLGGIGSGKTTRAIHPLLIQLLDQECGGLIFDIKGDFHNAVLTFGEATEREIVSIGPNYCPMNLLVGLTPEVAASFLKSVFMLGNQHRGDSFWLDTATELCRNVLGVLYFVPQHYSLHGLYNYLFDIETKVAIDEEVNSLLAKLETKEKRLLNSYLQYQERIFDKFEEKVKSGVTATVAQVLAPFNHPDLVDAFCSASEENRSMEDVLNGAVYLVELPLATWGLGGKVVYTLIKLRFFNVMQQRLAHPDWEQEHPVFFMCDEFQEIVSANKDGLSDLNFWDKSRSSKTIGIISAQAISSFYAAIGDRDVANALLQNFRQKLCFKTEDTTTISYFNSLADKVEVTRKTQSYANSANSKMDTSTTSTENLTFTDKPILDGQLFREMHPEQAVALLSIRGHSMDDVLQMFSVYV
jgi:hypothetical protein